MTDPVNSSNDSIYSGGVKQDTVCPGVTTGNVNDKADLGRIYVATETLNGHVYLFLAWERQIDNTINSDVFVSFEFDQGALACTNNDGFVQRTKGDLLFDYNFQSGNSTIDVQQSATQTAYDTLGNVRSTTDALAHTTRFEYDSLNRKISQILSDPAGSPTVAGPTTQCCTSCPAIQPD